VLIATLLAATGATFAPPLDTPIVRRFVEERVDAGKVRRFETLRRVTFRRDADGYVADLETLAATGEPGGAGHIFQRAATAAIGRHRYIVLDATGRVVAVRDLATEWTAYVDAIERAATRPGDRHDRAAFVRTLVSQLRGLPATEQIARLAEPLGDLIGPLGRGEEGMHPIQLPARAAGGTPAVLDGKETAVLRRGDLCFDRTAQGTAGTAQMALTASRCVDPATGIVRSLIETNVVTIGTAGTTARRLIEATGN
jgi:hypothetical protein